MLLMIGVTYYSVRFRKYVNIGNSIYLINFQIPVSLWKKSSERIFFNFQSSESILGSSFTVWCTNTNPQKTLNGTTEFGHNYQSDVISNRLRFSKTVWRVVTRGDDRVLVRGSSRAARRASSGPMSGEPLAPAPRRQHNACLECNLAHSLSRAAVSPKRGNLSFPRPWMAAVMLCSCAQ